VHADQRERGRFGGRPPALTEVDIAAAKALLVDPDISTKNVAKRLGVSVATLYRYIPAARSVVTRGE